MRVKRIVIDTNIVISALLFNGKLNEICSMWQKKRFTFLVSKEVLEEYIRVLTYPKFNLSDEEIKAIIDQELLPFVTPQEVKSKVNHVKEDPDDNKFLSLAVDGKADLIVSGDKHLLNLKTFESIKIVTAGEFLEGFGIKLD